VKFLTLRAGALGYTTIVPVDIWRNKVKHQQAVLTTNVCNNLTQLVYSTVVVVTNDVDVVI